MQSDQKYTTTTYAFFATIKEHSGRTILTDLVDAAHDAEEHAVVDGLREGVTRVVSLLRAEVGRDNLRTGLWCGLVSQNV